MHHNSTVSMLTVARLRGKFSVRPDRDGDDEDDEDDDTQAGT